MLDEEIKELNRQYPTIDVPKNKPQDIEKFIFKYLSHWLRDRITKEEIPPARFHRDIYYVVSHPRDYPYAILVAPRGFAKSIITCFFSPMFDAIAGGTSLFEEILIIGSEQSLASRWIVRMKNELTNNEKIVSEFGELSTDGTREGKWTEDEILLANGVRIIARGRGGSMRGLHPQKIIIDDIEGDEGALSAVECEKIDNWLKATVIPMQLDNGSVLHWDGTFLAPDSVLHKAYYGKGWDENWFRYKIPAIHENQSVWPERFPLEKLEATRIKQGSRIFSAEYMNEPISSVNPIIRREWIQYFSDAELPECMYKVLAVDPAITTQDIKRADKTAIGVIGADNTEGKPKNRMFVLDVDQGHWDMGSTVRRIFEMYRAWHPNEVIIETTAYQKALAETLRREASDRGLYLPITEVKPTKDKGTRLQSVAPMIEAGDVYFRKTQQDLIDQLLLFPTANHDDLVDFLSYALGALKNYWEYVYEENAPVAESVGPAIDILGM